MRRSAFVGIVAGAAFLFAATTATTLHAADEALIAHFTQANVTGLLKELGATDIAVQDGSEGSKGITYKQGQLTFIAILQACKAGDPGCLGLTLLARFSGEGGSAYSLTTVNGFNASRVFAQAHVYEKDLYLMRYVISDGGISRTNLRSNLVNFWGMPAQLQEYFQKAGVVAQASPSGQAQLSYAPSPLVTQPSVGHLANPAILRNVPPNALPAIGP